MDGAAVGSTWRSPVPPQNSISTLAFNQPVIMTPKGLLLIAEIVSLFGLLVWILIGGTDYFHLLAICWVMFVAILCWIVTLSLFIMYLTAVPARAPHIPWTTSLCINASATGLYLIAAVVNTAAVNETTRGRHNFKCWSASACFAFLTTLSYAWQSSVSRQRSDALDTEVST
uniref:MARVEL domain-containing protein n=1 Tax=Periophthalmus magnuspinnatus TaxID=409849 RepID=A0A3B4BAL6_9GOBI